MELTTNLQKLQGALRIADRMIGRTVTLPILGAILLRTQKGHLIISATNLEMGVRVKVPAKIEIEGSIAVPGRVLSEFIQAIHGEKIKLRVDKNSLYITADTYKTQILGMKSDEFPIIPTIVGTPIATFPSLDFKRALGAVVDAASLSDTRPELAGVYVHFHPDRLDMAATDSFRLAEVYMSLSSNTEEDRSCIIPRTTVQEVVRLLDENESTSIYLSDNQIAIQADTYEFVSRLIDGHYPDYKRVIPDRTSSKLIVEAEELGQLVRMTSVFSSSIADIHLKAVGDKLIISAKNSDRGESSSTMSAKHSGPDFELTINYRYLLDGLKSLAAHTTEISFASNGAPLILRGENNTQQLYLVMPLRS